MGRAGRSPAREEEGRGGSGGIEAVVAWRREDGGLGNGREMRGRKRTADGANNIKGHTKLFTLAIFPTPYRYLTGDGVRSAYIVGIWGGRRSFTDVICGWDDRVRRKAGGERRAECGLDDAEQEEEPKKDEQRSLQVVEVEL
ncbi:hypothetical protein KSS87_006597 [Heliosperma pusillum]|nr:hypothetical protein KSS87_006597 [Heliosperma pusillum]